MRRNLTIIGSDNGLAPDRREAIIWSLRGLIVKSAEHCGADYKPLDR